MPFDWSQGDKSSSPLNQNVMVTLLDNLVLIFYVLFTPVFCDIFLLQIGACQGSQVCTQFGRKKFHPRKALFNIKHFYLLFEASLVSVVAEN